METTRGIWCGPWYVSVNRVAVSLRELEEYGVKPEYIKIAGPIAPSGSNKTDYIAIWHRNPPYNEWCIQWFFKSR